MNLPSISPERLEQGGIVMTAFSIFTLSEWIGLFTFLMGVVTFVAGRLNARRDRLAQDEKRVLELLLMERQIEAEELEIEMIRMEHEGFVRRRRAGPRPEEGAGASPPANESRRRAAPMPKANGECPP